MRQHQSVNAYEITCAQVRVNSKVHRLQTPLVSNINIYENIQRRFESAANCLASPAEEDRAPHMHLWALSTANKPMGQQLTNKPHPYYTADARNTRHYTHIPRTSV
jgi:hypothetical protein